MAKQKPKRQRHSDEFKSEALALADRIGASAAANELGIHASQIYGWRSKTVAAKSRSAVEQEQATEIARLKRQLHDQAEELAILKKASAYFARNQK